MPRLVFAASLLAALLVCTVGCTRRSSTMHCGSLTPSECADDAGCHLLAGCCGAPASCVPAGVRAQACPSCSSCANLDEASCTAERGCRADYCTACSCQRSFVGCASAGSPPTPCAPLGCPSLNCTCHKLDEQGCIAAKPTLGCTPFYCPDCNGGNKFTYCYGPAEGAGFCPAGCPAGCHSAQECGGSGEICLAPGESLCPPICRDSDCSSDSDCAPAFVCEYTDCSCHGGRICVPACQRQSDCGEGLSCIDQHCQPSPCSSTTQCPSYFSCIFPPQPGTHPQCQRLACVTDADCDGGSCVDNKCFGSLGSCTPLPQ